MVISQPSEVLEVENHLHPHCNYVYILVCTKHMYKSVKVFCTVRRAYLDYLSNINLLLTLFSYNYFFKRFGFGAA